MLERFEEETGQPIDLRYPGYMLLATTEDNVATFRRNVALQHSLGVPTEWLDRRRSAAARAGTGGRRRAGRHLPIPGDGLADPNGVVAGYISAGRRLGRARLQRRAGDGVEVENGRAVAVTTLAAASPARRWSTPPGRGRRSSATWPASRCPSSRCAGRC